MSITRLNPDIDMLYKKTFHHHRNDSTELDVFEAARYFSGDATSFTEKLTLKEDTGKGSGYWTRGGAVGGRRISLDIPTNRNQHHHHHYTAADQKQAPVKDKKYKQPSSPGGKLASFLNSLFSQSKKKSKSTASAAPDEEIHGGARRKRRSSISHFSFGSSTNSDNNPSVSSKNSGFRTPPPVYAHVPTKNDVRSLSGHKQSVHCNGHETIRNPDLSWLDREKFRSSNGLSEKNDTFSNKYDDSDRKDRTFSVDKDRNQVFKDNYDEGAESDSSSDLFELQIQNYDLGDYSSGLPVFETTRPERSSDFR